MQVICQPLGMAAANCYLVIDENRALLIDPGEQFPALARMLNDMGAKLEAVILTHAHFDHIGGLDAILDRFNVDVYMNPKEFDFLTNPRLNASHSFMTSVTSKAHPVALKSGENKIGGFDVDAYFCPGHSVGSTVLKIGDNLFTGDVLFQGSIGRTDLPTGDDKAMRESLQFLNKLPDTLIVYPGHGPSTTLGQEKMYNPYLAFLLD